jgi:hypothetical protein
MRIENSSSSIFVICAFLFRAFVFHIRWASAYTRMVLAQSDADESDAAAAASNSHGSSDNKIPFNGSDRNRFDNADDDTNAESSADNDERAAEAAEAAVALTVPSYLRSVHTLHVQLQRLRGAADVGGDDDDSVCVPFSFH